MPVVESPPKPKRAPERKPLKRRPMPVNPSPKTLKKIVLYFYRKAPKGRGVPTYIFEKLSDAGISTNYSAVRKIIMEEQGLPHRTYVPKGLRVAENQRTILRIKIFRKVHSMNGKPPRQIYAELLKQYSEQTLISLGITVQRIESSISLVKRVLAKKR